MCAYSRHVRAKGLATILAALVAVLAAFALVRLTADGDHDRFDDGQLSFEYPSEWKQATWPVQSTFEKLVTYLSTSRCTTHAAGRRTRVRAASHSDACALAAFWLSGRFSASPTRIGTGSTPCPEAGRGWTSVERSSRSTSCQCAVASVLIVRSTRSYLRDPPAAGGQRRRNQRQRGTAWRVHAIGRPTLSYRPGAVLGWRTDWRTSAKRPANGHTSVGLESR